jgi:hypothetical protein
MIASGTGSEAHFSWFYRMDPQVSDTYGSGHWPVTHYAEYVKECEKKGDEIGLHTHLYRFSSKTNDWIIDNGDEEWVEHCILSSYEAFREVFGRNSDSHRFGDRFINDGALHVIEEMGSRFDLSMEPGFNEIPLDSTRKRMTGPVPKMTGVPKKPYRRSKTDFRKSDRKGKNELWIIPLSTGKIRTNPNRLFSPRRRMTLQLGLEPQWFQPLADKALSTSSKPYLGSVLRTDMLKDAHLAGNMRMNLQYLMDHPWAKQFVFSTPEEAMEILGYI